VLFVPFCGSLRIDWQARLNPRIESAVERMHVLPATISEFLRHPGAGRFMRSRAVGYDGAVLWYFVQMFPDLISGDANRIRQFLVRLSPRRRVPCVNKRELFTTIHPLTDFIRSDSRYFHLPLPPVLQVIIS
jgi:hypothetical protein